MAYKNNEASIFIIHFLFLLFSVEERAKIPAIIVFGDSTVDAGNNNYLLTVIRGNFKPYGRDFEGCKPTGRFSNGRLVTDFLSDALGIKPSIPAYFDPNFGIEDFATGVTFASSASGYDDLTSAIYVTVGLVAEFSALFVPLIPGFASIGNPQDCSTQIKGCFICCLQTDSSIQFMCGAPRRIALLIVCRQIPA